MAVYLEYTKLGKLTVTAPCYVLVLLTLVTKINVLELYKLKLYAGCINKLLNYSIYNFKNTLFISKYYPI